MKKLWLVSALSLGLILLAGCTPATQNSVEITSSKDMISMYNESKALTCNLTYESENEQWTSVMYIKDGMISQETTTNLEWEEATMYTLAKDGRMYVWGNVYGEGVWMSASYELDLEEELWWYDEISEDTKVTCVKWVKNNSVFDLPTDVEFTSMDEWLDYDEDAYYDYEDEEYSDLVDDEGNDEGNEAVEEEVVGETDEENVEEVAE